MYLRTALVVRKCRHLDVDREHLLPVHANRYISKG